MAEVSENTKLTLDLKTIGIIVAGALSLSSMWFTLQSDINDLRNEIESLSGDEFVKKMEYQLKDELIRTTILQIEKSTEGLSEDIKENKEAIKQNSEKLYENKRR
jgi:hypothetical protein|tara:strand:+ start:1403 stop:1717 length:315 start_codon:yes stop_codon:yes gene_type:complete